MTFMIFICIFVELWLYWKLGRCPWATHFVLEMWEREKHLGITYVESRDSQAYHPASSWHLKLCSDMIQVGTVMMGGHIDQLSCYSVWFAAKQAHYAILFRLQLSFCYPCKRCCVGLLLTKGQNESNCLFISFNRIVCNPLNRRLGVSLFFSSVISEGAAVPLSAQRRALKLAGSYFIHRVGDRGAPLIPREWN